MQYDINANSLDLRFGQKPQAANLKLKTDNEETPLHTISAAKQLIYITIKRNQYRLYTVEGHLFPFVNKTSHIRKRLENLMSTMHDATKAVLAAKIDRLKYYES